MFKKVKDKDVCSPLLICPFYCPDISGGCRRMTLLEVTASAMITEHDFPALEGCLVSKIGKYPLYSLGDLLLDFSF